MNDHDSISQQTIELYIKALLNSTNYRIVHDHCISKPELSEFISKNEITSINRASEFCTLIRQSFNIAKKQSYFYTSRTYSIFGNIYQNKNHHKIFSLPLTEFFLTPNKSSILSDSSTFIMQILHTSITEDRMNKCSPKDLINIIIREIEKKSAYKLVLLNVNDATPKNWKSQFPSFLKDLKKKHDITASTLAKYRLFEKRLSINKNVSSKEFKHISNHLDRYSLFTKAKESILASGKTRPPGTRKNVTFYRISDTLSLPPFNVEIEPATLRKNVRTAENLIHNAEVGIFPGNYLI